MCKALSFKNTLFLIFLIKKKKRLRFKYKDLNIKSKVQK